MIGVVNATNVSAFVPAAQDGRSALRGAQDDDSKSGETSTKSAEEPATKVSLSKDAKAQLGEELSDSDKQKVAELKRRDAEVRAHEHAHLAAAGGYANGGIHYEFQRGPDDKQYAVGGHVSIDASPIAGDPQRTIQKAQIVRRAALAPADPSSTDRRVASQAQAMERQARAELAKEQAEKLEEDRGTSEENTDLLDASLGAERPDHTAAHSESHEAGETSVAAQSVRYALKAYRQAA